MDDCKVGKELVAAMVHVAGSDDDADADADALGEAQLEDQSGDGASCLTSCM